MRSPFIAVALFALAFSPIVSAQTSDGGTPDGGVSTDGGTQGEGGSERDGTEGDDSTGRVTELCRSSSDCNQGFACAGGRCRWSGFRKATTEGCLATLTVQSLALLGIGAIWLRSRRRS